MPYVDCYWVIESDASPNQDIEKIIPDGFIEIIYHYGDTYRISLTGDWKEQNDKLFAGQIDKHFYIENDGRTGMIGIKLRPETATLMFGIDMSQHTNQVTSIANIPALEEVANLFKDREYNKIIDNVEGYLINRISEIEPHPIQRAIDLVFEENGMTTVQQISKELNFSQRQLERYFKKFIGLSPKLYMRIIRFNYIFELIKNKDTNWQDLVFESGYYDQSHFIKNFQEFTGEDPTKYGFDEKNMANFFLKKLEN